MAHSHQYPGKGNIKAAFFLNVSFTIIEIIGGFITGSIAVLSDALHDLGDSLSLGMGWYLENKSKQKGNMQYTYGYGRFSLLGALINAGVLIGGSIFIISEAISELSDPKVPQAKGMIVLAILGIMVNSIAFFKLKGGGTMNKQILTWHLLEDVLGWIAILIVSIVLLFKNIPILDPILALGITAFILVNIVKRLIKTMEIFLQKVPEDIDLNKIEKKIISIHKVKSTHHTHVWSLEGEQLVISIHVETEGISSLQELEQVKCQVKESFKGLPYEHLTIEMETEKEKCEMKLK